MLTFTDSAAVAGTCALRVENERPVLVLMHFFGGSRREWLEVSALLAPEYRTIAIDSPGFGESRDVAGYSVEEMAAQFAAVLTHLHLERYVLVGHSMTGKVAAVLAGDMLCSLGLPKPEKLILLTPSPIGPEPIPPDARAKMLARHGDAASCEAYVTDNSALPMAEGVHARAVEDCMRSNPAAWTAWLERGSYEDWTERVAPLGIETLVIAGSADSGLGPAVQEQVTLPNLSAGRMVVVEGSGHLVPMEAPERLAALLREFVGA